MLDSPPHAALIGNHGREILIKIRFIQVIIALAHDELIRHISRPRTYSGAEVERLLQARFPRHDRLQLVQVLAHNVHLAADVGFGEER